MASKSHSAVGDCAASRPRCRPQQAQRLFNCRRCNALATVCTVCDRGQQYCSPLCRDQQRALQVRQAGQRYQQRERGRQMHAARQRAYMAARSLSAPAARPQAKSTASWAALPPTPRAGQPPQSPRSSSRSPEALSGPSRAAPCCCNCGRRSCLLLRRTFLRRLQR